MYDFGQDLDRFHEIAIRAHNRNSLSKVGPYIRSQSIVESVAHKRIASVNRGGCRVLEVGIGGGEHIAFEKQPDNKNTYIGLDLQHDFLRICRDTFSVPVVGANVKRLPFQDGAFDAVIACSLLEHVQELDRAVAEIARVLGQDGRLLASIPANGGLAVQLYKLVMTYPYLRLSGIKRPSAVWHYLNVNSMQRVQAVLNRHFAVVIRESSPLHILPWFLSPLCIFVCTKK